jgi:hypothetical protein
MNGNGRGSTMDELGMEFASMEAPDGAQESSRRFNRLRWGASIMYLLLAFLVSLLPLAVEADETLMVYLVSFVTVGGAIILMAILASPMFWGAKAPVVRDGTVLEDGIVRKLVPGETYRDVVRFDLALYIVVPMIIVFAATMVLYPDPAFLAIMGFTVAFLSVLVAVFLNLEVLCDRKRLRFHYGPVGKDVPLGEIVSARAVSVHPLRDYMGYGIRLGPDGSVGYIASGNVGVRISLEDGKEYVVTMRDPQGLVDYIRSAKAKD